MLKKLSFITLVLTCIFGLSAMDHPRTVEQIIIGDDLAALQELITSGEVDPNTTILGAGLPIWAHSPSLWKLPLPFAAQFCCEKSVEYLLPLTQSNEVVLHALNIALVYISIKPALGNYDVGCRFKVAKLVLDETRKRGIDIQETVNQDLRGTIGAGEPKSVYYLLSLGADRTIRFGGGESLIEAIRKKIDIDKLLIRHGFDPASTVAQWEAAINLLRTYAPDLKTRTALNILNQVREGKMTRRDFEEKPLPHELIELIAKLANADKEAEAKWVAIGMPSYRQILEQQEEECMEMEIE